MLEEDGLNTEVGRRLDLGFWVVDVELWGYGWKGGVDGLCRDGYLIMYGLSIDGLQKI